MKTGQTLLLACCFTTVLALASGRQLFAQDMGIVPLLDGERNDSLNTWGGTLSAGNPGTFTKDQRWFTPAPALIK